MEIETQNRNNSRAARRNESTDNCTKIKRNTQRNTTMANPSPATRFQAGNQYGGRTKGARARLSDKFFAALSADFDERADSVIATVRQNDPAVYLNIVAKLMPRELEARLFATVERALIAAYAAPPEPLAIEHKPRLVMAPIPLPAPPQYLQNS
jgi:hypothetical protein